MKVRLKTTYWADEKDYKEEVTRISWIMGMWGTINIAYFTYNTNYWMIIINAIPLVTHILLWRSYIKWKKKK